MRYDLLPLAHPASSPNELNRILTSTLLQINFQDPSKDWKICNSWFVKQSDFWTTFSVRDIPQPVADVLPEEPVPVTEAAV